MLPRGRLMREAKMLLGRFMEEISTLRPRCVILYGSYAKGLFTEGSDIDVCVIAGGLPRDELARRSLAGLYSTPRISAIGFYPEEFLDFLRGLRFLAYDIVSEGIVIFDDDFFEMAEKVYRECAETYGVVGDEKGWRWDPKRLT